MAKGLLEHSYNSDINAVMSEAPYPRLTTKARQKCKQESVKRGTEQRRSRRLHNHICDMLTRPPGARSKERGAARGNVGAWGVVKAAFRWTKTIRLSAFKPQVGNTNPTPTGEL